MKITAVSATLLTAKTTIISIDLNSSQDHKPPLRSSTEPTCQWHLEGFFEH